MSYAANAGRKLRSEPPLELSPEPPAPSVRAEVEPQDAAAPDAASLADLWLILWRGRGLIVGMAIALTMGALIYCLVTPPQYAASAEILIDPREKQVLTKDVNPSSLAPDGGVAQVDSQVRVMQSSGVLLRAIRTLKLAEDRNFDKRGVVGDVIAAVAGLLSSSANIVDPEVRALRALKKKLAVKRADKQLVVELIATAETPERAAQIANAIAEAYLVDQATAKQQSSIEATDALTARLEEQRRKVQEAEDKVQRYKTEKRMVSASGQLVSEQQLTDLNRDLDAARARTGVLRAQIDQLARLRRDGASSDSTAEAIQSATIAKLREQESMLVQRSSDLQAQLGARHPAIEAIQLQLSSIRRLISTELERISKAARTEFERAQANERRLASDLERLKADNLATGQDFVRLRELERDLEASRTVYAAFLLRANETREQANIDSTNARIITRATPPQDKSWPLTGILVAGALGAGLGLGALGALGREYMRPTILSPRQVEAALGAPLIGQLPKLGANGATDAAFQQAVWSILRRLFDMTEPSSDLMPVRSVLIAMSARDAKWGAPTTLALACAAARAGEAVAYIDAASTNAPEKPGLSDILRGERMLEQVMRFAPETDVHMIEAGVARAAPAPRVAESAARRLLMQAGRRFDLLVIYAGDLRDTPWVAPLIAEVDEILLLGEMMHTPLADLSEQGRAVKATGRQVTGILLSSSMKMA